MWSITVQLMKKSARMLIPAGIAILIGTAFIAATFLFGNTMNDSLARQATAQFGGANYMTSVDNSRELPDEAYETIYSHTVDDFQLDRMLATAGVNGVRADISGTVTITAGDRHASSYALTTAKDEAMLPVTIAEGTQPVDANEIALTEAAADQLGVTVGDRVTVNSQWAAAADGSDGQGVEARVVGLTDDPNGAYSYYGGACVLSDNVMAAMTGTDDFGAVTTTGVFLDLDERDPAALERTISEVTALLPEYFTVSAKADAAQSALESLGQGTSVTTVFLLSFGVLAMFVAALVIANTFQVLVAQRRRTLALLRTIGAKKGQLYASVLFEAGLLGLIASALGVALGCGLMAAVCSSGLLDAIGGTVRFVISWQVFAIPMLFGIVMTVLASLSSARSATAVTPLEALRPIELTDTRRAGRVRAAISILLIAFGMAICALAAWQMWRSGAGMSSLVDDQYSLVLLAAIGGCAMVFLGMVISAVFWLPALMRGVGAIVAMVGPSAKVAHANVQKNPRRVAATGAALLIGVTLVSTIATGAASAKQTMGNALDTRYSVDMVALGADMTDQQAAAVAKVDGVERTVYAPATITSITDDNGEEVLTLTIGITGLDELARVMNTDLSGVSLDKDTAIVSRYSSSSGKQLRFDGDMTLTPAAGETEAADGGTAGSQAITLSPRQVDFRRVASYYGATAFVDASHFTDGQLAASEHVMLIKVDATGTTLNNVFNAVQAEFSSSSSVNVTGPIAERAQWETMIDSMMALMVGLIAVAVLIALVGVANTLSLSVIERTRESATLRAIGMTRGQLRRSLAVEALLLALVSGVAGIVLGTLFGWLGSYMVFSLYGATVFPFEWGVNGIVLAIAALAALLASVFPARRAVRTPPVEALAEA